MLGVCLGHQSLGEAFGGRTVRATRAMHGKTGPVRHEGEGIFDGEGDPVEAYLHAVSIFRPDQRASLFSDAMKRELQGYDAQQVFDAIGRWPRAVRAGLIRVEELGLVAHALVPVGTHHDPFTLTDLAVLGLPGLHAIGGQQEILVLGRLRGAIACEVSTSSLAAPAAVPSLVIPATSTTGV